MNPELNQALAEDPEDPEDPESPPGARDRSRTIIAPRALPNLEHFNIQAPRRAELIAELAAVIGRDKISATFWALLQVCALESIESMIRVGNENPAYVTFLAERAQFIPLHWKQKIHDEKPASTTSSSTNEGSTPRKRKKTRAQGPHDRAKERDRELCVLTKEFPIDVAHIHPFCLISTGSPRRIPRFWEALSLFWPPETISVWKREIFRDPNDPTKAFDHCANLMCMAKDVHAMWGDGMFAIRPLEYHDDNRKLDIEVYWQTNQGHKIDEDVSIRKQPASSIDLSGYRREDGMISGAISIGGSRVQSGHRFTLETSNPNTHPLPNKRLLEMQWHLNRVVALSGAAEAADLDEDTDEEGEGPMVSKSGLVEAWVSSFGPYRTSSRY